MFRRMLFGAVVATGTALALPASAVTISLTVASGGIDGSNTRTCTSVTCGTPVWSLASGESFAATGTITIDTTLNSMTIALAVASSVLDASGAQSPTDLGATSLVFTGGTYVGVVGITDNGGGNYSINSGQTAGLGFTLVEAVGAGTGYPVTLGAVRVTGGCLVTADGTGQCGLTFGSAGTTPFEVGGIGFGSYSRFVRQTFNVGVVPEPTTLLLVAMGLGALAVRRAHAA
jgi:hypothetical protein